MTIANTNVVAKVAAVVAGLGLVAMSFSFAPTAKAATAAEMQAQIATLMAQITALQAQMGTSTTMTTTATFTRDLTIGSTGSDVTALQTWLIGKGFAISAGATGYFGAQTKAALAAYQSANMISPAAGYFGPVTRAKVNAAAGTSTTTTTTGGTTTTTTTSTLSGGEADLTNFDLRNEDGTVSEAESGAKLATARFDVDGGDVNVGRAELTFDPTNNSTSVESKPWQFFDKITVWDGTKKVGSADASSKSDWDDNGSGTSETYTIHIDNISDIVKEGSTANLTFAADVSDGIDTVDLAQKFSVFVPDQGIRAVDSVGVQQYVGSDSNTVSISFESKQSGDLSIRESDTDPDASILVADDKNDSDTYSVFAFDIKNKDDADVNFNDITIMASTTGTTTVGAGNVINKATLTIDGKDYDGDIVNSNTGSTTLDFDNLDATVSGNDTVTGTLKIRLAPQNGNYAANGVKLTFSLAASDVDAEGADTGDTSDVDGIDTSRTHTVLLSGIDVEPKSTSENETSTQSGANYGTYSIKFDVTAVEDDAYIASSTASSTDATKGVDYAFVGSPTNVSGSATASLTASNATLTNGYYKVSEGSTATFTLTVTLDTAVSGQYEVDLTAVNFNDSASTPDSTFTVDPRNEDFKTNQIYIPA